MVCLACAWAVKIGTSYDRPLFTLEQIQDLHDRLGNAETLSDYVRSLAALGVLCYDSFVSDGHSVYLGHDGQRVSSPPAHAELSIAENSDRDAFLDHLRRHDLGETSYLDMSKGLAERGIEKWTVDTQAMTMTFYGPVRRCAAGRACHVAKAWGLANRVGRRPALEVGVCDAHIASATTASEKWRPGSLRIGPALDKRLMWAKGLMFCGSRPNWRRRSGRGGAVRRSPPFREEFPSGSGIG